MPRDRRDSILRFALAACLALFPSLLCRADAADTVSSKKRIVLLYSHRTVTPINADWDRGIRRALNKEFPQGLAIDIEYLDLGRFDDDAYLQHWRDLLARKYADHPIDLVVPIYVQAFQFTMAHRESLFPQVPIVFCSVPRAVAERARSQPGVTGVAFELDFEGTIALAEKLFPRTRRVVTVSGGGKYGQAMSAMAQQALSGSETPLMCETVAGLPMQELVEHLGNLNHDDVVLMLTYDEDNSKNEFMTADVVTDVQEKCPVPIFGLYDTLLGHGILGGSLLSAEAQGELAGAIAARVLKGEDASKIQLAGLGPGQVMVDARQLSRWKIGDHALPVGAEIRFREAGAWEQYGQYLIGGLILLILQTVAILTLILSRSRRIRAEQSLLTSRREARDLAGRLLTAQEEERRRIGRELHDDVSQRMAAAAIEAERLEQQAVHSQADADGIRRLKGHLISLSEDVHQLSRQIHPAILDDLGLEDALRSECDRLADRAGIAVQFRCGDLPRDLPKNVASCLYRIAQEALWNAAKYASSDRLNVQLTADPETVHLEVRDFGKGFDVNSPHQGRGVGLASMKERARLVDGSISIQSAAASGTAVSVCVPLNGASP